MENANFHDGPLYYRHSGKVSPGGLLLAVAGGSAAAVALGAAYAVADLYNPVAGYVTFLLTGGCGWALGTVIGILVKGGKLRNVQLVALLAIGLASLLYVISWDVWLYALLQRGGMDVSFFRLLLNPGVAWRLIVQIDQTGAWTINGATPSGMILALIWLAEAGLLLGIPVKMALRAVRESPFCEKCNRWCATREILSFRPGDRETVVRRLEARDFAVLEELGKAPKATHYWKVAFQGCPDCDTTQTLRITEIKITVDNKGKSVTKTTSVIERLRLAPEETVAIATIAAKLNAPPVESAPGENPTQTEAAEERAPEAGDVGRDEAAEGQSGQSGQGSQGGQIG
jgi:hypothetical protein